MPRQTTFAKPGEISARWFHVDASGQVVGRLATRVATILMGKHRPEYTPHVESGDFVIITNAEKSVLTGRKGEQKIMERFDYYPSGRKTETYDTYRKRHPDRYLEYAITRMLPKTKLGKQMAAKLKVYAGPDHPHQAQQPIPMP